MFEVPRTMLTLDRRGLLFGGRHVLAPICPETGRLDIEAHLEPVLVQLSAGYRRAMDERTVALLGSAAKAWNRGDAGRAAYDLIQVRLPDPNEDAGFHERIDLVGKALADGHRPDDILKTFGGSLAWMGEARVPAGQTGGGQWTAGEASSGDNGLLHYVAERHETRSGTKQIGAVMTSDFDESKDPKQNAKKTKFVRDHIAAASIVAHKLGITASQVLGLSAKETGWGTGDFVVNGGNNFFSPHYPAPGGGEPIPGHHQAMAQYPDFASSAESFRRQSGSLIDGITDPTTFVRTLQDVQIKEDGRVVEPGRYGIDTDPVTGKTFKVPSFVPDVVSMTKQIRQHIAE